MKSTSAIWLSLALAFGSQSIHAGLFSPKGDSPEEKRQVVLKQREEMLAELYKTKPELKDRMEKAAGYATFKQTDVNLFLLASGRGYGVLRDNKTGKDTFMCVASLGTGVGMGVKDLRVIFLFNDAKVMQQFVEQGVQFGGKGRRFRQVQGHGNLRRGRRQGQRGRQGRHGGYRGHHRYPSRRQG